VLPGAGGPLVRFDITDFDPDFVEDSGLDPYMDPSFVDPTFVDSSGGSFGGMVGFVVFLMVVGVVVSVVMSVRRARTLHRAGIDPLDPDTDMQVRLANRLGSPSRAGTTPRPPAPTAAPAPAPAPERSVQDRLAEVDRLHAAGTISAQEHDAARGRILGSL
jgi:hypothetical protein